MLISLLPTVLVIVYGYLPVVPSEVYKVRLAMVVHRLLASLIVLFLLVAVAFGHIAGPFMASYLWPLSALLLRTFSARPFPYEVMTFVRLAEVLSQ